MKQPHTTERSPHTTVTAEEISEEVLARMILISNSTPCSAGRHGGGYIIYTYIIYNIYMFIKLGSNSHELILWENDATGLETILKISLEMMLSHVASFSQSMSPWRAIWTHFGPDFAKYQNHV